MFHWRTKNLYISPRLRRGITATLQQARQATHNSFQLAPKWKMLLPIDTAETSETSTTTAIGFRRRQTPTTKTGAHGPP